MSKVAYLSQINNKDVLIQIALKNGVTVNEANSIKIIKQNIKQHFGNKKGLKFDLDKRDVSTAAASVSVAGDGDIKDLKQHETMIAEEKAEVLAKDKDLTVMKGAFKKLEGYNKEKKIVKVQQLLKGKIGEMHRGVRERELINRVNEKERKRYARKLESSSNKDDFYKLIDALDKRDIEEEDLSDTTLKRIEAYKKLKMEKGEPIPKFGTLADQYKDVKSPYKSPAQEKQQKKTSDEEMKALVDSLREGNNKSLQEQKMRKRGDDDESNERQFKEVIPGGMTKNENLKPKVEQKMAKEKPVARSIGQDALKLHKKLIAPSGVKIPFKNNKFGQTAVKKFF